MISAKTFQWTLCPLGHFLALIVQCRIHGASLESLMEAFSRSLFWNHFFVFFSGHPQALTRVTYFLATTSNHFGRLLLSIAWFIFLWSIDHGLHIKIVYMMDEMWLLDDKTHFGHTWPGQGVKAVFLRCPPSWPLVASSSSPSGWRARRQAPPGGNPETSAFHLSSVDKITRCQGIAGESRQLERYLPCVSTHARGWLVRTKGARERVDLYSRQELAHA